MDDYLKTLKEKNQCSLCEDSFIEPKLLVCFHVFCKLCVRRHAELIGQLNVFKCSKCTAQTYLPELNDVKNLKPSPLHARIEQVLAFVESDKMCSVCEKHPPASWHCFDCDRSMCNECKLRSHTVFMKDHKVVCLSELEREDLDFMLSRENPCEYHSNQVYEFYCKDCDQCICISCLKTQCGVHCTIPLNEYICVSKAAMQKNLKQLEVKLNEMQKQLETLKEMAITTRRNGERAKTEVRTTVQQLVAVLHQNERELIKQIEQRIEKVEELETKGQCAVDQTQRALDYMTKLEEDGRLSDMNIVKDMQSRSESIEIPIKDESNLVFAASKESRELKNAGIGTITMTTDHTTSSVEVRTEEILRKFRSILNKLTPQTFQTLIHKVIELEIDTPERLDQIVNIIFEKAINEPGSSVAYANMCRCLIPKSVKVESKDGKDTTLTFRKMLLNKCQKEFEREKSDEIKIHVRMEELSKQGLSDKVLKAKKAGLAKEELSSRRRTLGNIRFIGELFRLKMLTESIMHDCVIKLFHGNDEESFECLCTLLSTIGKDLDHVKAKPRMEQYFDQINKIIEAKTTSARCRCMLQDVKDLRAHSWVPQRKKNNPKTIEKIHQKAAEEERKMLILINQPSVGEKRDEGRDSPIPTVPQADEVWTTVPGRQRNVSADPKKFQNTKKRTNVDTESISLGLGGRGPGMWARGSSGGLGSAAMPGAFAEQETMGNRFSALGGEGRRDPGSSRQGTGAGRQDNGSQENRSQDNRSQDNRSQGPTTRHTQQDEREKALEAVRSVVQNKESPETIASLWSKSGLSLRKCSNSEEDEMAFIENKNLKAIVCGGSSEKPHAFRAQKQLRNLILSKKASNEEVFIWIDANVQTPKEPQFIRALVTAVCESCRKGDSDDSCERLVFKEKCPLLQKYIDNNRSLELQALFALQALSVQLHHPRDFLKSFFNGFYDEEVVSEGAFYDWENDSTPSESQGKGTAKTSTVQFFEWIRSAEEDK